MLSNDNKDYIIQETAGISAELRIVHSILEHISLRLECIEDVAFNEAKQSDDWHYDTVCKCDRCSAMRNAWSESDDYRMD